MGTKRSSGTVFTPKGVTQGNTLIDPNTGQPVDVIQDNTGTKRLAVDANITAQVGDLEVNLDADNDSVSIGDAASGNLLKVNADGSIDANMELDATSGDSVLVVGTEDGTPTGTQHNFKIDSDGNLIVLDENTASKLDDILTELTQKTEPSNAQNIRDLDSSTDSISVPGVATATKQDSIITELEDLNTKLADPLPLPTGASTEAKQDDIIDALESIDDLLSNPLEVNATISDLNANKDDVAIAGTEDGTSTGIVKHFVNNTRLQILASHDREQALIYADFGTKNQRIIQIDYTSPTFPGIIARKTINYTLVGTRYRRDNLIWSIV